MARYQSNRRISQAATVWRLRLQSAQAKLRVGQVPRSGEFPVNLARELLPGVAQYRRSHFSLQ